MYERKLAANIAARNRANTEANRIQAVLIPFFAQYVGQKILKADNSLLAKIKVPDLGISTTSLRNYRDSRSNYSLSWEVSANEPDSGDVNGHHTVTYANATAYIGELDNGVLKNVAEPRQHRTDWTEAEIIAAREELKAAQRKVSEAQSKLGPFGEYDR